MDTLNIGKQLVAHANAHRADLAVDELYADNIVSIEPFAAEGDASNCAQGIAAIRSKHAQWYEANEVHAETAVGPYMGHQPNKFAVKFHMDITPRQGQRLQMEEVALYTVADGKIVKEEFFYLMDEA